MRARFVTIVPVAMNQTTIIIAAVIVAGFAAVVEQLDSKETTQRYGAGGAKFITVHQSDGNSNVHGPGKTAVSSISMRY